MGKKNKDMARRNKISIECEKLFKISSNQITNLWESHLEISRILEKIIKLENVKIKFTERFEAVEEFIMWLKKGEADFNGISITKFSGYDIGLRADVDFYENDLVLKIPRKLIFNVYTAAAELKDLQSDMLITHMPQVALGIALLVEKHKQGSKWKPYIDMLPKKYSTILYMTVHDLEKLKGSPTLEAALKLYRNVARQYSYFHKVFQSTENSVSNLLRHTFTYDEYRWAVSTIMTRQNVIPRDNDQEMVHSLIPMWDMCNHEEGKITTEFSTQSDACECYAMHNFKTGDQIFIYYGPRSNSEFFIHSGFVYADNQNDNFVLRLGISKADSLRKKRLKLLSIFGLTEVNDFILQPKKKPISGSLLTFLRIFTMNETELNLWLKSSSGQNIEKTWIIEEVIDEKIRNYFTTRLNLLLGSCITYESESTTYLDENSQPYTNLIAKMRRLEKEILKKILASVVNDNSI